MFQQTSKTYQPVEIYYIYSHKDERLREKLETHLSTLRQQGLITEWHDRKLVAGANWQQEIDQHLQNASLILLLVSPDFLYSDYCYGIEMQSVLDRQVRGEAHVIPILLRPVDWQGAPFAFLHPVPYDGKAVTLWSNQDEAFVEIAKAIRTVVEQIQQPRSHLVPELASSQDAIQSSSTCSCVLSFAPQDQGFAEQLYTSLQENHVSIWFAPEDLRIGDKKRTKIDQIIHQYDKLLLVLSHHSVTSDWIEFEVEAAFDREEREKIWMLFPLRLDAAVMNTPAGWAAHIRRTRFIGDFTRWRQPDVYQRTLARLLRDLKTER